MKTTVILSAIAAATPVLGFLGPWSPPGTYDKRGPCPMLNTLANHGALPRHGKDLDRETTETVLLEILNLNRTVSSNLFDFALTTNPTPNATTFSLDDLGNHNILEHDASLSRTDAYFGSTSTFNQTIFDETRMYWTDEIIDFKTATDAVVARAETSNKTNPEFSLSELAVDFSFGESVAFIYILGDMQSKTVNRSWVEYWFTHERMPEHLGWKRPDVMFHPDDFFDGIDELEAIAAAMTPEYVAGLKRRMPHGRF
ncbi:heme-thiolate peroxidase [Cladorrhinum sp. PSN259]|nr:heme-thiolate peroxidase [Cladorrhinum sp. PSN259]